MGPAHSLSTKPSSRCLRVFAFDPQASIELDTAPINDAIVELPWEEPWEDSLAKGPVNDYLEVVDYDPASACFYQPVDLDDPMLLAQHGLPPSDGNPQFHQQMVFAVAMKTIRTFERALGRMVLWMREPPRRTAGAEGPPRYRDYIKRLRIYPHAMREANAYYSPQKAALLFGYFRGKPARDGTGGGWIFTCLSQDIVAHETAHAILHGMWPRSIESCNADALAFHEAFADIIALFQHFTVAAVVRHEMRKSGGAMRSVSLLNGLAQQFGRGTGREGPLRFALQMVEDEEKELAANGRLNPDRNARITQPHKRGQILVAAVFDVFVTIFEQRTDDLFRLAGRRRGDTANMSVELIERLVVEAQKAADHVLRMCIRGLDYLPPVDVTFGEYLRAILTADADLVPVDRRHYRVAFAEAFRKRGVTVRGCDFVTVDTLLWEEPAPFANAGRPSGGETRSADTSFAEVLPRLLLNVVYDPATLSTDLRENASEGAKAYIEPRNITPDAIERRNLRDLATLIVKHNQKMIQQWLAKSEEDDEEWEHLLGICLRPLEFHQDKQTVMFRGEKPRVEVHSVRVARRQGPDGQSLHQLIIQVTQRRRGYFDPAVQAAADKGELAGGTDQTAEPDFWFRGGATLLVDLSDGRVRRVVRKRIDDDGRLAQQRGFLLGDPDALTFTGQPGASPPEPFAFLHRSGR